MSCIPFHHVMHVPSKHIFKPTSYYLDAVCRIELHTSVVTKSCCELFKIASLEAKD